MCGRYTLAGTDPSQLRARWPIGERLEVRRRYNVAPGDDVLAVVQRDENAPPEGALLRWGLVPFWAADPKELGVRTINARAESLADRPAYREPFERRRCLVLADGFYEWAGGVPHWVTRADGEPFAFAGLWSSWRPKGAAHEVEPLRSCAIVTTAAAGPVRDLHDRMPVVLERSQEALWVDPASESVARHAVCSPEAAPALEYRPVSLAVNDARHDAPDCLDPPEQASLF